jgi:hypothetical protein
MSVFLMRNTGEHKYRVYKLDPGRIGHGVQISGGDIFCAACAAEGAIKAGDSHSAICC